MDEPKIVIAIKKFLADYAWDKSLIAQSTTSIPPRRPDYVHENNAIEEFLNGGK